MRPLNILLGDLTCFNSYTRSGHYVPLASGFISAYAKKLFGRDIQIKIVWSVVSRLTKEMMRAKSIHSSCLWGKGFRWSLNKT